MKMRPSSPSSSGGMEMGLGAVSSLFAGFVVWGGVGWLLDHWLGTRVFTPIGVVLGMALGIYAVVVRFGRDAPAVQQQGTVTGTAGPHQPDPGGAPSTGPGSIEVGSTAAGNTAAGNTAPTEAPPPAATQRETRCP